MSDLRLSVIIPAAAGRANNLHLVLTSLECQTHKQFEVIVVDDSGTNDALEVIRIHPDLKPVYVAGPKHVGGSGTTQPRNRGARNALSGFYVFADSDVILRADALEHYAEDFVANPNRIVAGLYHWLRPMRVTVRDVQNRFDDILDEKVNVLPWPNPQTHNICRDQRTEMFHQHPADYVYKVESLDEYRANWRNLLRAANIEWDEDVPPEAYYGAFRKWRRLQVYPAFLGTWSGNIAWPADLFWAIGGYWDELFPGAHEDGTSGLAACMAGIGLSFDERIVGGHLYHDRLIEAPGYGGQGLHALWEKEMKLINGRFHLEDYADGEGPRDTLPSLQTLSQGALEAWGVANWKTKSTAAGDGFRGM